MTVYGSMVRPLLFRLPADRAHDLAQAAFAWTLPWKLLGRQVESPRLATDLAGLRLENPIGLAPGFDKNGTLISSVDRLGFGYLVIGSITRHPRAGNPRPRMTRYPERLSLGNNLGLPSAGLDQVLRTLRSTPRPRAKIIASVTGFSADELLEAAQAVEPYVDAVELGLVCPNTTESHRMGELDIFTEVAEGVMRTKKKPVFVRLPPYHSEAERERTFALLDVCLRVGIEGVSTNGRSRVLDDRLPGGEGSISGRATFDDALRIVSDIARHAGGDITIRASGGIFSGDDAARMLEAGAHSVEVYSSLIYRGPGVATRMSRELVEVLERADLADVGALRSRSVAEPDTHPGD